MPALTAFANRRRRLSRRPRRPVAAAGAAQRVAIDTRALLMRGTRLPGGTGGGYVVVFDDVTELIQAQRDAAWAEVARRLAHEIKNPLTPIQLSAERLQLKLADKLSADDGETLTRGDADDRQPGGRDEAHGRRFRDLRPAAAPGRMQPVDLNALVLDVLGLYENLRPRSARACGAAIRSFMANRRGCARSSTICCRTRMDAQADIAATPRTISAPSSAMTRSRSRIGDNGTGFRTSRCAASSSPT